MGIVLSAGGFEPVNFGLEGTGSRATASKNS